MQSYCARFLLFVEAAALLTKLFQRHATDSFVCGRLKFDYQDTRSNGPITLLKAHMAGLRRDVFVIFHFCLSHTSSLVEVSDSGLCVILPFLLPSLEAGTIMEKNAIATTLHLSED